MRRDKLKIHAFRLAGNVCSLALLGFSGERRRIKNVMNIRDGIAAPNASKMHIRSFRPIPILISLLVFLGIGSSLLIYERNSLKNEMGEYLHSLDSIGAWIQNIEQLEGAVTDSSGNELQGFQGLSSVLHEPTAEDLEKSKEEYYYPLIAFSKAYYWSLEADAKTAISEEKAKEVLAQMTPEERDAAISDGRIDFGRFGIDFSDQKQKVAIALGRHFLNTLRKVADSG